MSCEKRDAAILNGDQAVRRQEADHQDAGDDHGGAGEDARAGRQARQAAQHADAAAHRSGDRSQEGVGEDAAGVVAAGGRAGRRSGSAEG